MRRLIGRLACALGLHHLARQWNRRRLLIVCYHGVCDGPTSPAWLLLPRRQFRAQLSYLKRHYRCLPIDAAVAELRAGGLAGPTACVTFDDGYRNNLEVALPVLRELNVPATVYLTTGLVGTMEHLWTTRLHRAIEGATRPIDLRTVGIDPALLDAGASRRQLAQAVAETLKGVPTAEREPRLARLYASLQVDQEAGATAELRILNWIEVREMADSGLVSFGAHTVHHDVLSRSDDERVKTEVQQSIRDVEAHAGATSRTFAYPNGRVEDFDGRAVAAIIEAGGTAAVTTIEGLNDAGTDVFALRRITVGGNQTIHDFKILTSGLLALLPGRRDRTGVNSPTAASSRPVALPA